MTQAGEAFVVDASVAAKWHLRDEDNAEKALQVLRDFSLGRTDLFAPHLIRYEVPAAIANATRGRRPRVQPTVGRRAIEAFLALGSPTTGGCPRYELTTPLLRSGRPNTIPRPAPPDGHEHAVLSLQSPE